jgi:AmmeMemoRadiSam system protein B
MERPKLRLIDAAPGEHEGHMVLQLFDPTGITDQVAVVPHELVHLLALLDGTRTIDDIQTSLALRARLLLPTSQIGEIIERLDEALLLDSERFRSHLARVRETFDREPVRRSCAAGRSYPDETDELRQLLDGFLAQKAGPSGQVAGLIAPHIDFQRGGPGYAHAYKGLAACTDADVFVIFGTAHQGVGAPYILTRKGFETPLGVAETAEDIVKGLASRCSGDLYADELLHRSEHSIEFQVVMLQHVLGDRPFRIVPVLCGSTEPLVSDDATPMDVPAIREFLDAMRETVAELDGRACTVAGADLAHMGRQFGHDFDLTPELMADVEAADRAMLDRVLELDADGFYDNVRTDDNARNVCGVPPIYALLQTTPASDCSLLSYHQATETQLQRSVTFAALALTR